jgi:glycerophosphoryl diester phosphodiesterase
MTAVADSTPWERARARGYPALIAHRAGDGDSGIEGAVSAGADLLEVDLWVHRGRFEARHERALYPVPLLYESRRVKRRPGGFDLAAEIHALDGRAELFLDLKNGGERAATLIREALDRTPQDTRLSASSPSWHILRRVHAVAPQVEMFYSADVPARLDLLLSVAERDQRPSGISCRHTLLTENTIARLQRLGLVVVAWTVDELDRAAELARLGVDGITTHRVAELHNLFQGTA